MSCEDDQSECMELYQELKKRNVVDAEWSNIIDGYFADFDKAYEQDESVSGLLDEIAWCLRTIIKEQKVDVKVGWFVSR